MGIGRPGFERQLTAGGPHEGTRGGIGGGTPQAAATPCKAGCIGASRERFERELKRGRYVGRMIVVIEGTLTDVCAASRGVSQNAIVGTLAAWTLRYCPYVFTGSVQAAADFAFRILAAQVRDVERMAKAISLPASRLGILTIPAETVDQVALWDIRCNLAIISILAEHRASQPETSFPMRTTVTISEDAKTIARLLGYPEENIGQVVETYGVWEIEAMANDPDHLLREIGDLVWEDREECQGVARQVTEHVGLLVGTLQVIECPKGWSIASRKGLTSI